MGNCNLTPPKKVPGLPYVCYFEVIWLLPNLFEDCIMKLPHTDTQKTFGQVVFQYMRTGWFLGLSAKYNEASIYSVQQATANLYPPNRLLSHTLD